MSGSEALLYAYLAGTALQVAGNEEQRRERRNILNASMADTDKAQQKATETVQAEAQQLSPAQRAQQMAQAEQATYSRTMGDIQGAGGVAVDTAAGGGAVSSDFARAKAASDASEGQRLSAVARELAKVRAPGDVALEGSLRRGAISERLGSLWNQQRARSGAARMDAESVDMPAYGTIGGLVATGAGAAMGGAGGAGTYAGASSVPTAANYVNSMDASSDAATPWWTSYRGNQRRGAYR